MAPAVPAGLPMQGSLDELSQALVNGGAASLRAASLPEGLLLPSLPSWRSTASAPAAGMIGVRAYSTGSSTSATPTCRGSPPLGGVEEPASAAMDEGA